METSTSTELVKVNGNKQSPPRIEKKPNNCKPFLPLPSPSNYEENVELDMNSNLHLPDVDCPDGSTVILCSFRSMNRVFVRSAHPVVSTLYDQQIDQIHMYGINAPPIKGFPTKNTIVIAELRDQFHRAKILEGITKTVYRIQLLDTGMAICIESKLLRKANDSISNLPILVKQFQLDGTPNAKLPLEIFKKLSRFESQRFRIVYTKKTQGSLSLVNLIHVDNFTGSLNQHLKDMDLSSVSASVVDITDLDKVPNENGTKTGNDVAGDVMPKKLNNSQTPSPTSSNGNGNVTAKNVKETSKKDKSSSLIADVSNEPCLLPTSTVTNKDTNNNKKEKPSNAIIEITNNKGRCMIPVGVDIINS